MIPLSSQHLGCWLGSDGKLCLVAQGIYKGLGNCRAFLLVLQLCNFVVSPLAISLSFKREASILMAKMTGLKTKPKTKQTGENEASIHLAHSLAIYNTKEKYLLL